VWDLDSGELLRTLEGHAKSVEAVAVSPDGRRAVSASRDNTLRVWDLDSGELLRTLEGHAESVQAVAVSPDGRRAVSASRDNTLRVWDLDSGETLATFAADYPLNCCYISPQSGTLVAGDSSGRVHFLRLENP
jgi:WD40 repeat protein